MPTAQSSLVLDRLRRVVAERGDKAAVRFGDASLTYLELLTRSEALAAHLAAIGVGAGDLVGIAMDRSPNMVVAVIGVWKAGAAFVPLDPDYPELRLAGVLEDAAPRALVTDRRNSDRMQHPGVKSVVLADALARRVPPVANVASGANALAYVIFTSGSTGRPKGVEISHGALASFLTGIQRSLLLRPSDTLAAVTTLAFDISILEIMLPLMQGATVVVLDRKTSGDGRKLAAALDASACTFLQATPATWRLLLDAGWNGKDDLTAICGGESLPRPLAEKLLRRSARLFNAYGPTEATIWATIELVQSGDGPVPIGRALPSYRTHVLDRDLSEVASGAIGQLYLGGPSLAAGYLNDPEETARRFVVRPGAGRLYATGDLVREMDDGRLIFVGRDDEQVKIHGFRVELGDIEFHLLEIPGVKEAAVVLWQDVDGAKKLAAYLVREDQIELASAELRKLLATRLPHYMIPHHYVQLTELPRTPNNKVDRKRLPAPEARDGQRTILGDPLERYLQSVWVDVLEFASIGADDSFFDLGGDSIQAARITNRVEEWLGELLWPVLIFDAPTIAEFADLLRKNYPDAVAARTQTAKLVATETVDRVIDDPLITEFNALIQPVAPFPAPATRNAPALFVLSPPRSGSTLLRVMLAGHPGVFAPPELELLTFNTMRERTEVFSGRESYRLEGTIRAVMEIKDCGVDEARAVLAAYEERRTPVSEFYGIMQSWLDGRLLVDKTPANCLDREALRRIEDYFEEPLYIHLTRHPLGMIRSFLEARLSTVFFRRVAHGFSSRELAELIWLTCHCNTLAALEHVPAERKLTVSFEALTRAPGDTVEGLCEFLGIELHPEMLEPGKNREKKMTDGLHPESKMMGDPKLHQHNRIDPAVADRWRDEMRNAALGTATRVLARELGYTDLGPGTDLDEREEFFF